MLIWYFVLFVTARVWIWLFCCLGFGLMFWKFVDLCGFVVCVCCKVGFAASGVLGGLLS